MIDSLSTIIDGGITVGLLQNPDFCTNFCKYYLDEVMEFITPPVDVPHILTLN